MSRILFLDDCPARQKWAKENLGNNPGDWLADPTTRIRNLPATPCNLPRDRRVQAPEVEVMNLRQCRVSLFLLFVVATGAHAQGLILPRPLPNLPHPPALSVKRHRIQVTQRVQGEASALSLRIVAQRHRYERVAEFVEH